MSTIPLTSRLMPPCTLCTLTSALTLALVGILHGQEGPFPPDAWPPTVDADKTVHFVSVDFDLEGLNGNWDESLTVLSGGDQVTVPVNIGGYEGLRATRNYLNIADFDYPVWEDQEVIDILVSVYGDAGILNNGNPRNYGFLTGTVGELTNAAGGSIPLEGKNNKWNWVLFRINNDERPSGDGRYVGTIPEDAPGGSDSGGVNGGTIRFQGVPQLIVRAIAFGEEGAFGEPEQINLFEAAEGCSDEPETNHAYIDINSDTGEHMEVMSNGNQVATFADNIGPADDKRRAVKAAGNYLNFGVVDEYLGAACNDTRAVKICIEYYDDPALTGKAFGPDQYATDALGGTGEVNPESWKFSQGTGQWVRQAYIVPAVNLFGVNAGNYTAGPRLSFDAGSNFYISRFDLAIVRVGDHPLAGDDPLADCFLDPAVCAGEYGNYAEMDLQNGVFNGLAQGNSGGDQEMIEETAGPADDQRLAVRAAHDDGTPGHSHQYLNFSVTDEVFGPSSQPNARLAICVTYWDNPELQGATFRPEVYKSDKSGVEAFEHVGGEVNVFLEGTDTWAEAYFEIPDIKFSGVNQGPQAAARFTSSDKIHISRVRYAVIRECGPTAGENPLENCLEPVAPSDEIFQILEVTKVDDIASITWESKVNTTYTVEKSTSLESFNELEDGVVGTGELITFEDKSAMEESAYYRVREE